MSPTDEELLHTFYAGETAALEQLVERHWSMFSKIAKLILEVRTGSALQASNEWDTDDRLNNMWIHVLNTQQAHVGRWPHERISALTWLIHLLCLEMDGHLGFQPPF